MRIIDGLTICNRSIFLTWISPKDWNDTISKHELWAYESPYEDDGWFYFRLLGFEFSAVRR